MKRALVLTDEQARHPFRASLPAHVPSNEYEAPAEVLWKLTCDDVRGFATVYFSVFVAVLVFVA